MNCGNTTSFPLRWRDYSFSETLITGSEKHAYSYSYSLSIEKDRERSPPTVGSGFPLYLFFKEDVAAIPNAGAKKE
ncbi:MAG: hypothetical protein ACTHK8_14430 [Ginsengibacter sp.]